MISYSNWSVLTVAFMVVTYLALSGVALCAVLYLVGAKWRFQVRHLAVSLYSLFPLAFVLLLILLLGGQHTFPWAGGGFPPEEAALQPGWYTLPLLAGRELIGMLVVMFVWRTFIKRQEVSERSEQDRLKFHRIACWVPFFTVLYATMISWDFEMTLIPAWRSAIYGMENLVSNFGMFLSFLVIWIYLLNTRGALVKRVEEFVYNYLAQMMLAFTLLFMYTYFSQYLIIWYGNIGDERDRIDGMENGDYSALWFAMIALKFVIPFATLVFPVSRHNPKITVAIATCIIIGTLCERYVWIAGIHGTGTYPVLMFIVVAAAVGGIGYMLVRDTLRRKQLIRA